MGIEIDWLTVILATLSTMAVGSIWYSPKVFGRSWEAMVGLNKKAEKDKPNPTRAIITTLIVSFITALVLSHVIYIAHAFFHNTLMQDAISTSFWVWAGFTAARMVTHDAFEGRSQRLTIMNICHELVTFMVMGVIIGWLAPY